MARNREAMAIIGGKAQGKSTYVASLFDSYDRKHDKILILSPTDPPAYQGIKRINAEFQTQIEGKKAKQVNIALEKLKKFKAGRLKYYDFESAKRMVREIHTLCQQGYMRNGLIVFEDCTNYIDPWPDEGIRNFLVNHRMFDLDLIFTTHALRFLPKFCRGMVSTITTFKTAESYINSNELRNMQFPASEKLFSAWQTVMKAEPVKGRIQPHRTIETGI